MASTNHYWFIFPHPLLTPCMKNKLFMLLATLPIWSYGQDTLTSPTKPSAPSTYAVKNAWHISALLPSLTYERRVGPHITLVAEYGMGFILADPIQSSGISYGPDLRMNSKLVVGIRRYYDFERRVERGRSIRYNSSGYIMAKLGYHFAPADRAGEVAYKPAIGPYIQGVWGFQRTYRKHLYLNLGAGPQFSSAGISLGLDAAIGYTLPIH